MGRTVSHRLIANGIIFAMVFFLTARPILNAADPEALTSTKASSLAQELFDYSTGLSRALHERPIEERSLSDYARALDSYWQVIRLNTDNSFSAESLARRAELQREMADVTGDSAFYQQAIETYRRIILEHPHSAFVGDALTSIAQVYEENLQDLDGAAGAYRELITYFPNSVLSREASAVLARFEAQLMHHSLDVIVSSGRPAEIASELTGPPRLTNVRNFSGPDYARVVIDLSDKAEHTERRSGNNRLSIQLRGALVSSSLFGRRFIVKDSSLLKRITVVENGGHVKSQEATVQIDIEVSSLADYSAFRLSDPERIVIDLHAAGSVAKSSARDTRETAEPADEEIERVNAKATESAKPERREAQPKADSRASGPIMGLPEIPDPIIPMTDSRNGANSAAAAAAQGLATAVDAKAAEQAIKRIVIDPGHGGHDTGTISSGGLREKDLVLDVARRLRAYIKHNYPDIEVILTRDSDRFVALEERTAIANSRHADLFISVHANASQSKVASGVETYFVSPDRASDEDAKTAARENAQHAAQQSADKAQPVFASVTVGNRVAQSRELARYIQSGLVRGIGAASPRTATNRGVKHAAFTVLLGASMPSVLAEVSFLSNPKDEALLQTSQFRERIAASLYAGLNAYLKKK